MSLTKATSVASIPALVAAVALVIAGCGGDTDAKTTSTASSALGEGSSKEARAPSKPPSPEEEREEAAAEVKAVQKKDPDASSAKGKQGPKIATPKGEPEPTATPQQQAEATVIDIALSSPALPPSGSSAASLPATYTCDGKDSWPQLDWQGVPAGTAELALLAMNVQPVNEQIFFDWAVAGLDPDSSGLDAGRLPPGAVIGRNSFGQNDYSICPSKGSSETYMFILYALPRALSPKQGFDPLALREEALRISGNAGLLAASYSRG